MRNVSELSDAALSELFAEKIAGYERDAKNAGCWRSPNMTRGAFPNTPPPFATSADAVLPFLHGWIWRAGGGDTPDACSITISKENGRTPHDASKFYHGKGTFARAVCVALLRAKEAA
jgi:hypothetical protein